MTTKQKKVSKFDLGIKCPNMTQTFFAEVIKETGLTHAEIAEKLDTRANPTLTENKISQYFTFQATLGQDRLLELAGQTKVLGWKIPIAEKMLLVDFFSQHAELPVEESKKLLKKIDKSTKRSGKAQIAALEKSVRQLAESDWDAETIIGMVIMITQKYISPQNRTTGGMVNPAWIVNAIGGDGTKYPDMAWLHCRFMTLEEYSRYLQAQAVVDNNYTAEFMTTKKSTAKPASKSAPKSKAAKKSPAKRSSSK